APRDRPRDAEAEGLAHRLLAREAARVALRRIRARVAVRPFFLGEAALAEARIALERPADPRDLDQVDADLHPALSSQSGSCAIDETIPSGRTSPRSTASRRNFPVRTSTVVRPNGCAPALPASLS